MLDNWRAARTALIGMLQTEEGTMRLVGEALEDIAIREFQDTDQRARDKFEKLYGWIPK